MVGLAACKGLQHPLQETKVYVTAPRRQRSMQAALHRGPLHAGHSTQAAPHGLLYRGGVADLFYADVRSNIDGFMVHFIGTVSVHCCHRARRQDALCYVAAGEGGRAQSNVIGLDGIRDRQGCRGTKLYKEQSGAAVCADFRK